jgi:predicted nucleic acid-binding protein
MIVVLDASAAIEIALNREYSTSFREVLRQSDLVLAPDTFPSEITNVFWKYAIYSDMPVEACEKGIDYCLDLIDDYIETTSLCREVFSESYKNNHSAYDLFYIVTARRYNASLLTRDAKMKNIADALKINILT